MRTVLVQLFYRYPQAGILFGIIVAIGSMYFALLSWQQLRASPQQPEPLTIEQATARGNENDTWVSLTNPRWHCEDAIKLKGEQAIPLTGQNGSVVILILNHQRPCAELMDGPATGVLSPISERRLDYLKSQGLSFVDNSDLADIWSLCGYCGPGNSRLGVILGTIFLIGGTYLAIHFARLVRQSPASH